MCKEGEESRAKESKEGHNYLKLENFGVSETERGETNRLYTYIPYIHTGMHTYTLAYQLISCLHTYIHVRIHTYTCTYRQTNNPIQSFEAFSHNTHIYCIHMLHKHL